MDSLDNITAAQPTLPEEKVVISKGDDSKTYFQQSESEDELKADERHEDGTKAGDVSMAEEQPTAADIPASALLGQKKESKSKKKKNKKSKDKDKTKDNPEETMNNEEQDKPVTTSPPESKKKEKKGKKAKKDKKKAASNAAIVEPEPTAAKAEVTTSDDTKAEETTPGEEKESPAEASTEEAIAVDPKHITIPISTEEGVVPEAAVETKPTSLPTVEATVPAEDKTPAGEKSLTEGPEPTEEEIPTKEAPTKQTSTGEASIEESAPENAPTEESPAAQSSATDGHVEGVQVDEAPAEEIPIKEAPVEETPIHKAPIDEAPIDEAPIDEAPIDEAPINEAPIDEAPTEEALTEESLNKEGLTKEAPNNDALVNETPIKEAPIEIRVIEEAPSKEAPTEEAPTEEAPTEEAPTEEAPTEEAPTEEAPTEEAPTEEAPTEEAPTEEAPAKEAPAITEAPTQEAPAITEAPAVTEAPAITESPAITEAPTQEAPAVTEAPAITESPAITEVPAVTEAPTEEAPAIKETPIEDGVVEEIGTEQIPGQDSHTGENATEEAGAVEPDTAEQVSSVATENAQEIDPKETADKDSGAEEPVTKATMEPEETERVDTEIPAKSLSESTAEDAKEGAAEPFAKTAEPADDEEKRTPHALGEDVPVNGAAPPATETEAQIATDFTAESTEAPAEGVAFTTTECPAADAAASEAEANDSANEELTTDLTGQQNAGNLATPCSADDPHAEDKEPKDATQQDVSEETDIKTCPEKASSSENSIVTEDVVEVRNSEHAIAAGPSTEDAAAENTAAESTAVEELTTDITEEPKEPESELSVINETSSEPAGVVDCQQIVASVETTQAASQLSDFVPQDAVVPSDEQGSGPTIEIKDQHALEEQTSDDASAELIPRSEELAVESTEPAAKGKPLDAAATEATTGDAIEIEIASEEAQYDAATPTESSSEVIRPDVKPAPTLDAHAEEPAASGCFEEENLDAGGTKENEPQALEKESIISETTPAEIIEADTTAEVDETKPDIQQEGSQEDPGGLAVAADNKSVVEAVAEPGVLDNIAIEPEEATTVIMPSESRSEDLEADATLLDGEMAKKPSQTNSDQATKIPGQETENITVTTSEITAVESVEEVADEPQQDAAKEDAAAVMETAATESSVDGMNDEVAASPAPVKEPTSDLSEVGNLVAEQPAAIQPHEEFREPVLAKSNTEDHVALSSKLGDSPTEDPTTEGAGGKAPVVISEGQPDETAKAECPSVDDELVKSEDDESPKKTEHEVCTLEATVDVGRNNATEDTTSERTTLAVVDQEPGKDVALEIEPSKPIISDLEAKHEDIPYIEMEEELDGIQGSPAEAEGKDEVLVDILAETKAAEAESAGGEAPAKPEQVEASQDAAPTEDKTDEAASEESATSCEAPPNAETVAAADVFANDGDKTATDVDRKILTQNGKVNLQENALDEPTGPTIDDTKTVASAETAKEVIEAVNEQAVVESEEQRKSQQAPGSGNPAAGSAELDARQVAAIVPKPQETEETVSEPQKTEKMEPVPSVKQPAEAPGKFGTSVQPETSNSEAAPVEEDSEAKCQGSTPKLGDAVAVEAEATETVHAALEVPVLEPPAEDKEDPSLVSKADNQHGLEPKVTGADDDSAVADEAQSDVLKALAVEELADVEEAEQENNLEAEEIVAKSDDKHETPAVIDIAIGPEEEHKAPETAAEVTTIEAAEEVVPEPGVDDGSNKPYAEQDEEESEEGMKTPAAIDGVADQTEKATPQEAIESVKKIVAVTVQVADDTSSHAETNAHVMADSEGKPEPAQQAVETTPDEDTVTSTDEVVPTSDSAVEEITREAAVADPVEPKPVPTEDAAADPEATSELSIEREAEAVVTAEAEPKSATELQAEIPATMEAEPEVVQPGDPENAINTAKEAPQEETKEPSAEEAAIAPAVGVAALGSTLLVGANMSKDKVSAHNEAPRAVKTTEDEESKDTLGPIPGEEELGNKSKKGEILHFVHDTPDEISEVAQDTGVAGIGVGTSGDSVKLYPFMGNKETDAAVDPTDISVTGVVEQPRNLEQAEDAVEFHTNEGQFESSEQVGSIVTGQCPRNYKREEISGISKGPKGATDQAGQIEQSHQPDRTDLDKQHEILESTQKASTPDNKATVPRNDDTTLANDEHPVSYFKPSSVNKSDQMDKAAKKESSPMLTKPSEVEDTISPAITVVPEKPAFGHLQPDTPHGTGTACHVNVEEAVMGSHMEPIVLGTHISIPFAEEVSANDPLSSKDNSKMPEVTTSLAQNFPAEEPHISRHQQEHIAIADDEYPSETEMINMIATGNRPLEEAAPTQTEDLPIDHKSMLTQEPSSQTESVETLCQQSQPPKSIPEIECTPQGSDNSPISSERVDNNVRSDAPGPSHRDSERSPGDGFIAMNEEHSLGDPWSNFGTVQISDETEVLPGGFVAEEERRRNFLSTEPVIPKQPKYESPYGAAPKATDSHEEGSTPVEDRPQDDQAQNISDISRKSQETGLAGRQFEATAADEIPNEPLLSAASARGDPFNAFAGEHRDPQEPEVLAVTQRSTALKQDVLAFSSSFEEKIPSVIVKELTMFNTENEQPQHTEMFDVQEAERIMGKNFLRTNSPDTGTEAQKATRDLGQFTKSPQESQMAVTSKTEDKSHSTEDSAAAADDIAATNQEQPQREMITSACQSEEESSQNNHGPEIRLGSASIAAVTGAAFIALSLSQDSASDEPTKSIAEDHVFVKPAEDPEVLNASDSVRDNHESHPNSTSMTYPVMAAGNQEHTVMDGLALLPTTEFDPRATTPAVVIPDAEIIDLHRRKTLKRRQKMAVQDAEDTVAAAVVIYATAEALSPPASPKAGTFQHTDPAFSSLVERGRVVEEDLYQSDADLYFSADETSTDPQRSGGDRDRERHHRRHRHSHHSHRSSRSHGDDEVGASEHKRHSHSSHGSHHRRPRSDSTGEDAPRTPPRRRDSGHSGEGSGSSGRRRRTPEEQAEHERRKAERLARESDHERRHRSDRYERSERPEQRSFRSEHSERSERSAHRERRRDTYSPERSQHRSSRRHSHSSQHRPERPERPERVSGPPVDREIDSQQSQKRLFDVKHSEGIVGNGQIPSIAGETIIQDAEPTKASAMPKRSSTTRSRYSFSRTSTDQSRPTANKTRESVDAPRGFLSRNSTTSEDNARRARKSERSKKAVEDEKKPSGIKGIFKRLFG